MIKAARLPGGFSFKDLGCLSSGVQPCATIADPAVESLTLIIHRLLSVCVFFDDTDPVCGLHRVAKMAV